MEGNTWVTNSVLIIYLVDIISELKIVLDVFLDYINITLNTTYLPQATYTYTNPYWWKYW
jgi:hypothetical protein